MNNHYFAGKQYTTSKYKNRQILEKSIDDLKPISHVWNGFDKEGRQRWYILLENGNMISSEDDMYDLMVETYFAEESLR